VTGRSLPFFVLGSGLALSACAGTVDRSSVVHAGSISVAVGPCFGFCPVYEATISSAGEVTFKGERHTAVLGERRRRLGAGAFRSWTSELAPFRPAQGDTARVECDAAISDTPTYTITWLEASGRRTVATHQGGCSSGAGNRLDAVLRSLPDRLGIGSWAKQTTRPGESRG